MVFDHSRMKWKVSVRRQYRRYLQGSACRYNQEAARLSKVLRNLQEQRLIRSLSIPQRFQGCGHEYSMVLSRARETCVRQRQCRRCRNREPEERRLKIHHALGVSRSRLVRASPWSVNVPKSLVWTFANYRCRQCPKLITSKMGLVLHGIPLSQLSTMS